MSSKILTQSDNMSVKTDRQNLNNKMTVENFLRKKKTHLKSFATKYYIGWCGPRGGVINGDGQIVMTAL